jgi:hypothetical protein
MWLAENKDDGHIKHAKDVRDELKRNFIRVTLSLSVLFHECREYVRRDINAPSGFVFHKGSRVITSF